MKRFALALAFAAALLACACAAESIAIPIQVEAMEQANAAVAIAPVRSDRADGLAPLSIVRGVQSFGDGYIVYPKVLYCAHAQEINDSILALTAGSAQGISDSVFTKYRIEYNHNGLFSLRMDLYDLYGDGNERLETVYMTYDVESGQLCSLSDLFDQADERWRGVMPDIITAQAQAKGITLLCDVMPVTDSQQFFLTEGQVVLVYELYEIATWSAGEPEFALSISQLGEFIPPDSPLAKIRTPDRTPAPVQAKAGEGAASAEVVTAALIEGKETPAPQAAQDAAAKAGTP